MIQLNTDQTSVKKFANASTSLFTMICVIAITNSFTTHTHADVPINVASDPQLLIDQMFFASSDNISLKIQPPQKTGEVTLRPEHPWESASLN